MTLAAQESIGLVAVHRGAIEQAQHTAHLLVELLGGIFSLLDELLVWHCQIVVVIGV